MYFFPNFEPACCSVSGSNCCFLTCIQVSHETSKVIWYSHLFKNFSQFIVIHTVKDFSIVAGFNIITSRRSLAPSYLLHFFLSQRLLSLPWNCSLLACLQAFIWALPSSCNSPLHLVSSMSLKWSQFCSSSGSFQERLSVSPRLAQVSPRQCMTHPSSYWAELWLPCLLSLCWTRFQAESKLVSLALSIVPGM